MGLRNFIFIVTILAIVLVLEGCAAPAHDHRFHRQPLISFNDLQAAPGFYCPVAIDE